MFKRAVLVLATIALVVPIGLSAVWLWGQVATPAEAQTSQPAANYSPAQTITVVGQGSVRIKPDIAQISIGVETTADTVSQAVDDNKTQMESIMAALSEAGIADKDIQTMNYSIQFDRYPQPVPEPVGTESGATPQYRVSNMVNVTVRNLDNVSTVLDAVVKAGANNIWGVSFSLEDQKPAQSDARANAIADAKERAQALADLNEVTLGPVMSVSEVLGGGSVPVPMAAVKEAAAGGGPISPGELEISYQVQVSYFIEP